MKIYIEFAIMDHTEIRILWQHWCSYISVVVMSHFLLLTLLRQRDSIFFRFQL